MHVLEESRLVFRTLPLDLDFNLHMNNGRYLMIMDLGRIDLMVRTGLAKSILDHKWMPVVGMINISYRRSLHLWNRFELRTRIIYWDEKWFYIVQEFRNQDHIYARALVKGGLRDREGLVSTGKILAALGADSHPPQPTESWRKLIEGTKLKFES